MIMNKVGLPLIILLFLFTENVYCQDSIYVASWNVENFFDTVNDKNKDDGSFTPAGLKSWNNKRFDEKMQNLAKVIKYMNDYKGPDILGIIEVEHKYLVDSLVGKYFYDRNYQTVSYESPDGRGIQNALLYDAGKFDLIESEPVKIEFFSDYQSRDILYVKLKWAADYLELFVNHWPSRLGGEERSQPRRITAAATLKEFINEKSSKDNYFGNIIIMGDFNDEPNNISLFDVLEAKKFSEEELNFTDSKTSLYNLAFNKFEKGYGTHLYENNYNFLDQIIVCEKLFDNKGTEVITDSFEIVAPAFADMEIKGKKIITPSFHSGKYLGGFSDHYPIAVKLYYEYQEGL